MPIAIRIVDGSSFTARTPCATVSAWSSAVDVRHRQPVVEERQVELAVLQHAGDALVVVGRQEIRLVAGWRQEPGRFEQFCACRKAIRVIVRFIGPSRFQIGRSTSSSGACCWQP